ncbi:3'-5' exonuclease [Aliidiomarina sp. Khilg15.8]
MLSAWGKRWQRHRQLARPWQEQRWLALDLETNGLDPVQDGILAAGWVPVLPPRIRLFEADYRVVRGTDTLSQSAVIHQLSSRDIAGGQSLKKVLKPLAQSLDGAILVAHHARFDWQFLQRAFREAAIDCQPLAILDTLKLEQNRLSRQRDWLQPGELTLAACRERYDLPRSRQHHALSDAVACAELFLAQAYAVAGKQTMSGAQLLRAAR